MDADLMAIIKMQPTFGKNVHLVWAYCELFGIVPLKTRRKKLRVLLEEMKRLFDSESFIYQKRAYSISQAGIAEALNIMVHRHWTDHLENHNYLKKIMISIAEASDKAAGKEAEKTLRKREITLQAGVRAETEVDRGTPLNGVPLSTLPPLLKMKTMPAAHLTPQQIAENKRKVRELMSKIGD